MNRQRILIGLLALALVFAGGLYAQNTYACGGCPAHAKTAKAAATDDATVTKANVETTSGAVCCAAGKAPGAKLTGADATSATKTDAKLAGAKQCTLGEKASYADACKPGGELMTAEATVAKLAHCGIDIRTADTEVLAAKLAEKGCGSYKAEQWATMIKSAKALDAEKVDAEYASAKDHTCSSDKCPMTVVANEMAAAKDTKNN